MAQSLDTIFWPKNQVYNIQQPARIMQITMTEENLEDLDEADLSANFLINMIIICDFIALLMVKKGQKGFHSLIAQ